MNTMSRAVASRLIAGVLLVFGGRGLLATPHEEAAMPSTHAPADTTLRMQVERTGDGPPLVLVGGGLTGSASWEPHAERLAPFREVARLQLLSVEYGLDDRPLPPDYSVRTESRALAAALEEIGWDGPVDLVAWSYGAAVSLDYALEHPDRLRTLTLIEPPALWVLADHGRALPDVRELEDLLPDVRDEVTLDALERFLRTAALVPPGTQPESLPQWESWVRHCRSLRNGSAVFQHDDDVARLRSLSVPVLLVTGHGTSPFLRAVHDTLANALPDVRTLELPGGHAPHLAAMDDFLARLAEFHEAPEGRGGAARQIVRSRDGTPIAFWRSGTGPPLLLVHGATADHTTTWRYVIADLERRFTVLAMDRRGRGGSGDAPDYDLAREAEDVAAIVETAGEPVSVLGHSYGALVALEASLLTPNIRALVLYEGVALRGRDLYEPGFIERLESMLAAGNVEGVLTSLFTDLVQMPADELEMMRAQRETWATRLRNTPSLPRELRADRDYVFEPARFEPMRVPTLLLVGEESPARERTHADAVAAALPDARVVLLPRQQHAAMYSDPELFVTQVARFLDRVP